MNKEFTPDRSPEELPDWLKKIKKEGDGMKVPDGYFESFPDRMMAKINEIEKPRTTDNVELRSIPVRKVIAWALAAAASFLVIISIWSPFSGQPTDQQAALDRIPVEEAMAYLVDHTEMYSWEEIVLEGMPDNAGLPDGLGLDGISTEQLINELEDEELLDLL